MSVKAIGYLIFLGETILVRSYLLGLSGCLSPFGTGNIDDTIAYSKHLSSLFCILFIAFFNETHFGNSIYWLPFKGLYLAKLRITWLVPLYIQSEPKLVKLLTIVFISSNFSLIRL
eukprot:Lithocolla_globosa_v1_NODE_807_length_3252_cov_520.165155.p3 type:complete len:116 gc:universal NODE_807_length_3252_cov_520.165155:1497-1844(+)